MNCLHDVDERRVGPSPLCLGDILTLGQGSTEQDDSGTLDRPRRDPVDRNASQELSLAIHREVARAIG